MKSFLAAAILCATVLAYPQEEEAPPSRELAANEAPITNLGLSPDETLLLSSDGAGKLLAWDLEKNEVRWEIEGHRVVVFAIGEDLVGHNPGLVTVALNEIETGETFRGGLGGSNPMATATCMAFSGKDAWVWIGTEEGVATRLTPDKINGWSNCNLKNGGITCFAKDSKGKTLAAGGRDGTVRFIGMKSANVEKKKILEVESGAVLALAADAKLAQLLIGCEKGALQLWKVKGGKLVKKLEGHTADITEVVMNTKGKLAASGDREGNIRVWNPAKGTQLAQFKLEGEVTGLVLIGEGESLAASTGSSEKITLWDLSKL